MSGKLSKAAIDYLRWLRDNQHHRGAWVPLHAPPGQSTHLELGGYGGRRKRVRAEIHEEARPYITHQPPSEVADKRVLYPNDAGLRMLEKSDGPAA